MKHSLLSFLYVVATAILISACGSPSNMEDPDVAIYPSMLRCEYLDSPEIDIPAPRLSWINNAQLGVTEERQTAYRILVADNEKALKKEGSEELVWDSGKVDSDESHLISYSGKPLESGKDYWWKVCVWDSKDRKSAWSDPGHWSTGLMSAAEWKATWIGAPWQEEMPEKEYTPAPMLRKQFKVKGGIASAKAFISGLGYFELYVNGLRAGNPDEKLVPSFTDYGKRDNLGGKHALVLESNFSGYRTFYRTYDITSLLKKGKNAVGAILGAGYFSANPKNLKIAPYGSPRLICQIEIVYKDGSRQTICSDASWKAKESPILMNDLYDGEIYDALRETPDWSSPKCDESTWVPVVERKAPEGQLTAQEGPSDRILERISPLSFEKQEDGSWKADFGRQITGWLHFSGVKGKAGDTLSVYYPGEYPDAKYEYVFKDGSPVDYAPRFVWFTFKEAIISGVESLDPSQIVAEAVGTDVRVNAEFDCSEKLFGQIETIWRQSQIDNMHSGVASDCPHREKLPYTGDGQIAMNMVLSNFDAAGFYDKWITDMRLSRDEATGYVPNGAPWEPYCGGGAAWGAAIDIMPWEFYVRYADRKMLEDNYEAMKGYEKYLASWKLPDGTIQTRRTNPGQTQVQRFFNLGDWAPATGLPEDGLVHTFYWWYCAGRISLAAKALGKDDDASYYASLAENIKAAFIKKFSKGGDYGEFGGNVYAVVMNVPDKDKALQAIRKVAERNGGNLDTGMLASRFLFEALAENGMNDLAFCMMTQKDFPSFGWWLEQGATTTWEYWGGQHSRNHPMMGGGLTWFYKCLAGVDTDPEKPGFRHFFVKPIPVKGLSWASYSTMTPYGKVSSKVSYTEDGKASVEVSVPVGCHATIILPDGSTHTAEQGDWKF